MGGRRYGIIGLLLVVGLFVMIGKTEGASFNKLSEGDMKNLVGGISCAQCNTDRTCGVRVICPEKSYCSILMPCPSPWVTPEDYKDCGTAPGDCPYGYQNCGWTGTCSCEPILETHWCIQAGSTRYAQVGGC